MGFPKVEYPTGLKLYSTIFALYLAGFLTALVRPIHPIPNTNLSHKPTHLLSRTAQ